MTSYSNLDEDGKQKVMEISLVANDVASLPVLSMVIFAIREKLGAESDLEKKFAEHVVNPPKTLTLNVEEDDFVIKLAGHIDKVGFQNEVAVPNKYKEDITKNLIKLRQLIGIYWIYFQDTNPEICNELKALYPDRCLDKLLFEDGKEKDAMTPLYLIPTIDARVYPIICYMDKNGELLKEMPKLK